MQSLAPVPRYNPGMAGEPAGPTRDGTREGLDPSSGIPWAFESPEAHWAEHDGRQVRYWRSRPPAERLARAAHYRILRHGTLLEPAVWTWRFVEPGEP
jgi:hypothetical protein